MDNQQICVKLIMDNLGIPFKMKSFSDRLVLQKAIYLAQEAGLDLGYYFSWYLKGPYSTRLASDGFSIADEIRLTKDESKKWHLDENSTRSIDKIKPFCKKSGELATNLELFASVHFLVKKKQLTGCDIITQKLHESGKNFEQGQVKLALGKLKENGLID